VTSAINRYYDPTTDQFLSIDPDVADTDQPYVFTNDDPLNAEDPVGECPLCSAADAVGRATVKTVKVVAKVVAKGVAEQLPAHTSLTLGFCANLNAGGGNAGAVISACAGKTSSGKAYSSFTVGFGPASPGAQVGVSAFASNATLPKQISGAFGYEGIGVGTGEGFGVDVQGQEGGSKSDPIFVGSIGLYVGTESPLSYYEGKSYTWVDSR
jgi:hypothetical protein